MNGKWIAVVVGLLLALPCAQAGRELALALKDTAAPNQEFVRVPAKYVLKKLSDTANESGNPLLSAFVVQNQWPGSDETKVTINLAGMSLLDAIQTVATAIGAGADFQDNRVVLKDPSEVQELVLDEPAPGVEPLADDGRKTTRSRKPAPPPRVSFSDISHALVFVESAEGRGSGFIAEMGGTTYFFSNQHNFLGATKLSYRTMPGTLLQPDNFEYSRSHDLVRMRLDPKDLVGLGVLKICPTTPIIGEQIVLYGNSAGGGVATELEGKIIGVGPSDIEITAKMVPGNSGSPVLNANGEVVGVATYATLGMQFEKGSAYEKMFKGTRFSQVRRYGIRIPEDGWVSDRLSAYLQQTYQLADAKTHLTATYVLVQFWKGNKSFASTVERMYSAYTGLGGKGNPPFEFKTRKTEEMLRKLVSSFKMNVGETNNQTGKRSDAERQIETDRVKRLLASSIEELRSDLARTKWKSNLLRNEAETVAAMMEEIVNQIEISNK